jgi:hypothetical protein
MKPPRITSAVPMLLLSSAVALSRPAAAAGPQGIQAGTPIDEGGNILISDAVAQAMANSGAGWVRLHFRLGPYPSDTVQDSRGIITPS